MVAFMYLVWQVIAVSAQYQWCTLIPPVHRRTTTADPLSKWNTVTPSDKKNKEEIIFEYITDNFLEGDILTDDYMSMDEQSIDHSLSVKPMSVTLDPHDYITQLHETGTGYYLHATFLAKVGKLHKRQ